MSVIDSAWLEELFAWLRIPSVSADPAHADDVVAAGTWVCDFVERAGGTCELVAVSSGPPLVVGEIRASADAERAPTVIVYGHFDVQPAGEPELWESPAFEPAVRDGWIYGRGAVDDKGNLYLLLKGAALLAADGALPVNVRVVCDGEEETGGHSVVHFLAADERGADACVIFDSDMPAEDLPAFVIGTRGIAYFHVTARTGVRDLHSGFYGGAALNAVHALMRALDAVVAVPEELRIGVIPPTEEELASWRDLEPGHSVLARDGARPVDERAADDFYVRTFAAPAVDVNGIHGGSPDLLKTVLPVEAHANVSIRLAPEQDPDAVAAAFECLLRAAAPSGTELEVEDWGRTLPGLASPDAPAIRLAQDAFERTVGRRPLLLRTGGTLPIVPALADRGIPAIVTGFGAPGHNIHSPNERFLARYVPLGVETARRLFQALGTL